MECEKYDFMNGLLKREVTGEDDFLNKMEGLLGKALSSRQKLTRSYLLSYPLMKDYFSKVEDIDLNKFTFGVYMIYGWMPRALRFNGGELIREEEFIRLKAKLLEMKGWDEKRFLKVVSADDGDAGQKSVDKENALLSLKKVTNGSIVGMSKLLHFINPKIFPIYDSNIAEVVGEVKTVDEYFAYVKAFHEFAGKVSKCDEVKFEQIRSDFEKACCEEFKNQKNLEVTRVRAIELVLFQIGKSVKDSRKATKRS